MQFAEKESFHHVVSNNLTSSPWTALITYVSFSLETDLYSKSQRSLLTDIGIKPIVSKNKEGYDSAVI